MRQARIRKTPLQHLPHGVRPQSCRRQLLALAVGRAEERRVGLGPNAHVEDRAGRACDGNRAVTPRSGNVDTDDHVGAWIDWRAADRDLTDPTADR